MKPETIQLITIGILILGFVGTMAFLYVNFIADNQGPEDINNEVRNFKP